MHCNPTHVSCGVPQDSEGKEVFIIGNQLTGIRIRWTGVPDDVFLIDCIQNQKPVRTVEHHDARLLTSEQV